MEDKNGIGREWHISFSTCICRCNVSLSYSTPLDYMMRYFWNYLITKSNVLGNYWMTVLADGYYLNV